tara:strand:- start:2273 stop:2512 length:240 start_codon:yes stop_codon:yes gene_type:complete
MNQYDKNKKITMINNNNFYKDFDLIFTKLDLENNEITNKLYNEFINLYDDYINNNYENKNIINDLAVKSFIIDEDGIIS